MAIRTSFDKANYAELLGLYCGYRWAIEADDHQRDCFLRHDTQNMSFADFCAVVVPYIDKDAPEKESYPARDRLYLAYARQVGMVAENLDALPEFWGAFCTGAWEAFEHNGETATLRTASDLPAR